MGDWQAAGLVKTSVLKPVSTTIEQPLVLHVMGHLWAGDTKTLCAVITDVSGWPGHGGSDFRPDPDVR